MLEDEVVESTSNLLNLLWCSANVYVEDPAREMSI